MLLGVQTKERQAQIQILVIMEYFLVLIQKFFLRKRWIAAIRRENWTDNQTDNSKYAASISSVVSQRKLWWLVEVVFLFVSVGQYERLIQRQKTMTFPIDNSSADTGNEGEESVKESAKKAVEIDSTKILVEDKSLQIEKLSLPEEIHSIS